MTNAERSSDPRDLCPHESFTDFVETIAALRAPDGCPWDKEQTHISIAQNMIEEAYEAVDAIEANDITHMREELGDVLLQVVLQSQIAADQDEFTIDDVCAEVNEKIIRRHPHVFGEAKAGSSSEVLKVWDQIKLKEKETKGKAEGTTKTESLLDSVPVSFPALMQAQKISRKAVSVGFEWETLEAVWDQVYEEIDELKDAYNHAHKRSDGTVDKTADEAAFNQLELECGDVLFALVNVMRKMGVNAEEALRQTCRKFRKRWSYMEKEAGLQGKDLRELNTSDQEELWQQAKQAE